MRKPALWFSLLLLLTAVSLGASWTRYLESARRRGIEVRLSLLPPAQWGLGVDNVQEATARVLPGGSVLIPRDETRRVGFVGVRERQWFPLHADEQDAAGKR